MVDEDLLTKEGAVRLAARLQELYGTKALFRVEQDAHGVWGVRSNMVRGYYKDGSGYYNYRACPPKVDNRPTRKSPKNLNNGSVEDLPNPLRPRMEPPKDS